MRTTRKTTAALVAFAFASALSLGVAGAAPMQKTEICHGTASATNPYVVISVNEHSFKNGHFDGYPAPSHGENNTPDEVWNGQECGGSIG